jgi:hypothetical protein
VRVLLSASSRLYTKLDASDTLSFKVMPEIHQKVYHSILRGRMHLPCVLARLGADSFDVEHGRFQIPEQE